MSRRNKKQSPKKKSFGRSNQPKSKKPFKFFGGGKSKSSSRSNTPGRQVEGTVQANEKGFGFFIPEDGSPDAFIPPRAMNGILNGDTIRATVIQDPRKEGKFIVDSSEIVKRAHNQLIGTIVKDYGTFFLKPDDFRITRPILLKNHTMRLEEGQKVVAKITQWPEGNATMEGQVVEVLGMAGDPNIDIKTIIKKYEWPESFPKEVEQQVSSLPADPTEADWQGRLDLRKKLIMTIDGADAKDFDDAISLERTPGGGYVLGVHIADVSHYVSEGTPLDKEAQARATSLYLADRVLPMLPHSLSDGLCSLREGVPRLTTSAFLTYAASGELLKTDFALSVIQSSRRGIYEEVQAVLDGKADSETQAKYDHLMPMLKDMLKLSLLIRAQREQLGALDFDFPEIRAVLGKDGFVVDVKKKERQHSHKLIEDFMVAANEAVASYLDQQKMPTLYRIHEPPDASSTEDLITFLRAYHVPFKNLDLTSPKGMQTLLNSVKGTTLEIPVSSLTLRSLKLAVYATRNAGHFGLALKSYCHFTSPIRRYPDLVVHRSLKLLLKKEIRPLKYEKLALQCSEQERKAEKAERESQKVLQLRFMEGKVLQEFDGIVKHLTAYGAYVELNPYGVEGFLPLENLRDDSYSYDTDSMTLKGDRGSVIHISDKMKVKVMSIDMVFQRMILAKSYD